MTAQNIVDLILAILGLLTALLAHMRLGITQNHVAMHTHQNHVPPAQPPPVSGVRPPDGR